MSATGTVASIYRYPVKGLTPEPLPRAGLRAGQPLPGDRRYAIENGPSGFNPADPRHLAKIHFLMLMRNERLATFETRYDEASHLLTIRHHGQEVARGDLQTDEGRAAIEHFISKTFVKELRGPPKVLSALGHSFSDTPKKVLSIINLASVAELAALVGQPVHPLRFRANLYVAGWPAWREFDLVGRTLVVGHAGLKVIKRIVRCAATNVDPVTGLRDLTLPHDMMRQYGHDDCGVYAEVVADGEIAPGDPIMERDEVSSTA
ncbi:MAG: MOSC domain-containing protein [Pseudomonadota bacterium]